MGARGVATESWHALNVQERALVSEPARAPAVVLPAPYAEGEGGHEEHT